MLCLCICLIPLIPHSPWARLTPVWFNHNISHSVRIIPLYTVTMCSGMLHFLFKSRSASLCRMCACHARMCRFSMTFLERVIQIWMVVSQVFVHWMHYAPPLCASFIAFGWHTASCCVYLLPAISALSHNAYNNALAHMLYVLSIRRKKWIARSLLYLQHL